MAEEEKIMAHAKKAVESLTNKNKKWKEKVKDFLFEILIIIVAVNITLWFHNWNDKKSERQQEKEFLIGIREDLIKDTAFLNDNIKYMQPTIAYYDSVWKQVFRNKIDADYVNKNSSALKNTAYLRFDYSLFENFKNSGNFKLVENKKLLQDITSLYSTAMPFYQDIDMENFNKRKDNYDKKIGSVTVWDSSGVPNVSALLNKPDVKYIILKDMEIFKERNQHINDIISEMITVIHKIDKELKDRFNYEVK